MREVEAAHRTCEAWVRNQGSRVPSVAISFLQQTAQDGLVSAGGDAKLLRRDDEPVRGKPAPRTLN